VRWCLRIVLEGDRFVSADLFEVPDSHIFGQYGAEIHADVTEDIGDRIRPELSGLAGKVSLTISSAEMRMSWRCTGCPDSGGGSGDAVAQAEQEMAGHVRATGHYVQSEWG